MAVALVTPCAFRFRQCDLRPLDAGYSSQILVPRLLGLPPLPQGGAPPLPQGGAGYDGGGGIDDALNLASGRIGDVRSNDGTAVLQNEQRGPELIGRHARFPREVGVGRETIALLD